MMADFQDALISRIFSVFWSGFLHRTTVNDILIEKDHLGDRSPEKDCC